MGEEAGEDQKALQDYNELEAALHADSDLSYDEALLGNESQDNRGQQVEAGQEGAVEERSGLQVGRGLQI